MNSVTRAFSSLAVLSLTVAGPPPCMAAARSASARAATGIPSVSAVGGAGAAIPAAVPCLPAPPVSLTPLHFAPAAALNAAAAVVPAAAIPAIPTAAAVPVKAAAAVLKAGASRIAASAFSDTPGDAARAGLDALFIGESSRMSVEDWGDYVKLDTGYNNLPREKLSTPEAELVYFLVPKDDPNLQTHFSTRLTSEDRQRRFYRSADGKEYFKFYTIDAPENRDTIARMKAVYGDPVRSHASAQVTSHYTHLGVPVRTEETPMFIKLAPPDGSARVGETKIRKSIATSDLLLEILPNSLDSPVSILPEEAGATLDMQDGKEPLGFLIRNPIPRPFMGANETLLPLHSVLANSEILTAIAGNDGLSAEEWLIEKYARAAGETLAQTNHRYHFYSRSHAQNVLLRVEKGSFKFRGFVLRDLNDVDFDPIPKETRKSFLGRPIGTLNASMTEAGIATPETVFNGWIMQLLIIKDGILPQSQLVMFARMFSAMMESYGRETGKILGLPLNAGPILVEFAKSADGTTESNRDRISALAKTAVSKLFKMINEAKSPPELAENIPAQSPEYEKKLKDLFERSYRGSRYFVSFVPDFGRIAFPNAFYKREAADKKIGYYLTPVRELVSYERETRRVLAILYDPPAESVVHGERR